MLNSQPTETPVKGVVDLPRLLEMAVDEEHTFLEAHQKRVAFYLSLITAVLGATIAGALKASAALHFVLLITGPLVVFVLCLIARDGTFRFYQRFLEAVTLRAKLEQALGLTTFRSSMEDSGAYWRQEALIPPRHLRARQESMSSEDFIASHRNLGYQRATRHLFLAFQGFSILLGAALLVGAFLA